MLFTGFPVKPLGGGAAPLLGGYLQIHKNMVFDYVRDVVRGNRLVITFAYRSSTDSEPNPAVEQQEVEDGSDADSDGEDEELVQANADAAALVTNS